MLARQLAVARPLVQRARIVPLSSAPTRSFRLGFPREPITQPLDPTYYPSNNDTIDPGMNGGYVNPVPEKRQFRDPYGDWWDKQERRNYGEPVHEDNDILGRFTPEEYTWTTPGKGLFQIGCFITTVFGLMGVVYMFYPDKPAIPRTFPHRGLEKALGGPGSVSAASDGTD
ncbi:NADH:ubiquinone oxidoreductase subunit [Wilcoxina mikolae CBS 423.85]|nr:NADH:ubiquinone oxidoreductase subunit [Wilcoxina mikolae CBS 423.85]